MNDAAHRLSDHELSESSDNSSSNGGYCRDAGGSDGEEELHGHGHSHHSYNKSKQVFVLKQQRAIALEKTERLSAALATTPGQRSQAQLSEICAQYELHTALHDVCIDPTSTDNTSLRIRATALQMAQWVQREELNPGQALYTAGDVLVGGDGDLMYIVVSGEVHLSVAATNESKQEEEKEKQASGAGDAGSMGEKPQMPSSATESHTTTPASAPLLPTVPASATPSPPSAIPFSSTPSSSSPPVQPGSHPSTLVCKCLPGMFFGHLELAMTDNEWRKGLPGFLAAQDEYGFLESGAEKQAPVTLYPESKLVRPRSRANSAVNRSRRNSTANKEKDNRSSQRQALSLRDAVPRVARYRVNSAVAVLGDMSATPTVVLFLPRSAYTRLFQRTHVEFWRSRVHALHTATLFRDYFEELHAQRHSSRLTLQVEARRVRKLEQVHTIQAKEKLMEKRALQEANRLKNRQSIERRRYEKLMRGEEDAEPISPLSPRSMLKSPFFQTLNHQRHQNVHIPQPYHASTTTLVPDPFQSLYSVWRVLYFQRAGTTVLAQGAHCKHLYFVRQGAVEVTRELSASLHTPYNTNSYRKGLKPVSVSVLGVGAVFGAVPLKKMERHYVDGHLVNVPPTLPLLGVSTMSYATMSANTVLLRVPLATVNGMFPHALGSRIHQSAELRKQFQHKRLEVFASRLDVCGVVQSKSGDTFSDKDAIMLKAARQRLLARIPGGVVDIDAQAAMQTRGSWKIKKAALHKPQVSEKLRKEHDRVMQLEELDRRAKSKKALLKGSGSGNTSAGAGLSVVSERAGVKQDSHVDELARALMQSGGVSPRKHQASMRLRMLANTTSDEFAMQKELQRGTDGNSSDEDTEENYVHFDREVSSESTAACEEKALHDRRKKQQRELAKIMRLQAPGNVFSSAMQHRIKGTRDHRRLGIVDARGVLRKRKGSITSTAAAKLALAATEHRTNALKEKREKAAVRPKRPAKAHTARDFDFKRPFKGIEEAPDLFKVVREPYADDHEAQTRRLLSSVWLPPFGLNTFPDLIAGHNKSRQVHADNNAGSAPASSPPTTSTALQFKVRLPSAPVKKKPASSQYMAIPSKLQRPVLQSERPVMTSPSTLHPAMSHLPAPRDVYVSAQIKNSLKRGEKSMKRQITERGTHRKLMRACGTVEDEIQRRQGLVVDPLATGFREIFKPFFYSRSGGSSAVLEQQRDHSELQGESVEVLNRKMMLQTSVDQQQEGDFAAFRCALLGNFLKEDSLELQTSIRSLRFFKSLADLFPRYDTLEQVSARDNDDVLEREERLMETRRAQLRAEQADEQGMENEEEQDSDYFEPDAWVRFAHRHDNKKHRQSAQEAQAHSDRLKRKYHVPRLHKDMIVRMVTPGGQRRSTPATSAALVSAITSTSPGLRMQSPSPPAAQRTTPSSGRGGSFYSADAPTQHPTATADRPHGCSVPGQQARPVPFRYRVRVNSSRQSNTPSRKNIATPPTHAKLHTSPPPVPATL